MSHTINDFSAKNMLYNNNCNKVASRSAVRPHEEIIYIRYIMENKIVLKINSVLSDVKDLIKVVSSGWS